MPVGRVQEIPLADFIGRLNLSQGRIPLHGALETTFRCNLRCTHCYVNQAREAVDEASRELPLSRHQELIDEFAAEGCINLLLTGGEPLVRPDFPELFRHAVRSGLRVTVFTNATLVDQPIIDLFDECPPACVEVTLYGATAATYERITRVPGSFARCRAGVEALHARGVNLKLKTMILEWNAHEYEAMGDYARRLGVPFRHDGVLNPRVDCGAHRHPNLQVRPERIVELDLSDPVRQRQFLTTTQEILCQDKSWTPSEFVYTCGGGRTGFAVDPYGRLLLCLLARRSGYDLRTGSFRTGWHEFLPRLRERRWSSDAPCRTCTLLPLCQNCPGVAEAETGDPEAQVELCCRITHLRVHALLGESCGHQADARCCLGSPALADPAAGGTDETPSV